MVSVEVGHVWARPPPSRLQPGQQVAQLVDVSQRRDVIRVELQRLPVGRLRLRQLAAQVQHGAQVTVAAGVLKTQVRFCGFQTKSFNINDNQ